MSFNVSRILIAAFGAVASLHAGAQVVVPLSARAVSQVGIDHSPSGAQKDSDELSGDITVSGWNSVATATSDASTPAVFASSASTEGAGADESISEARSAIYYDYTVIGATGPVPVDFDYALEITYGGNGVATAIFSVINNYPYYAPVIGLGLDSQAFKGSSGTYWLKGTATADATMGQLDQVEVDAETDTVVGQSASAFVDPRIYIDPAYLAANPGVSLEISDGIGNLGPAPVSSVPEPANVAFVLAGLTLITALRRRPQALRWSPEADPTEPVDPSMWSELRTQRPVVLGLLVWLLALAVGCVLLAPPVTGTEDWVSESVSNGQGAPMSPLDVPGCDAAAGAVCGVLEAPAAPERSASAH